MRSTVPVLSCGCCAIPWRGSRRQDVKCPSTESGQVPLHQIEFSKSAMHPCFPVLPEPNTTASHPDMVSMRPRGFHLRADTAVRDEGSRHFSGPDALAHGLDPSRL